MSSERERRSDETDLPQRAQRIHRERREVGDGHSDFGFVEMLPWSLRSVADAPNCGAEEKSAIPVTSALLRASGMTEFGKVKRRT